MDGEDSTISPVCNEERSAIFLRKMARRAKRDTGRGTDTDIDNGAKDIYMSATHAVMAPPALERLAACNFTRLAVTDTIPIGKRCDAIKDRLEVLSVAELLGDAIHRIHHNESVSALFKGDSGRALSE